MSHGSCRCRHRASEGLNLEWQLAVTTHAVARHYAASACSMSKVKAKAEGANLEGVGGGSFVLALTLCVRGS